MRFGWLVGSATLLTTIGSTTVALADTPSADDLAPIAIPNRTPSTEKFAAKLVDACGAVAKRMATPSKIDFVTLAKDNRTTPVMEPAKANAALDGWKATCDAMARLSLTSADLANLRAFRENPEGARLAILGPSAKPQGTLSTTPVDLGAIGTDLVQGLANFIYERAKAEALLYLQQRLKDAMCTPERRPFFRNLCAVFDNTNELVSLASMGTFLVVAARKDLAAFPDTALAYSLYEGMRGAPKSSQSLLGAMTAARLGLAVYRSVQAGQTPLDSLRSLHLAPPPEYASEVVLKAGDLASGMVDAIMTEDSWDDPGTNDDAHLPYYAIASVLRLDEMKLISFDSLLKADAGSSMLRNTLPLISQLSKDLASLKAQVTALGQAPQPSAGDMVPPDAAHPPLPAAPTAASTQSYARKYAALVTQTLQTVASDGGNIATALGLFDDKTRAALQELTALAQAAELTVAAGTPTDALIASLDGLRTIFDKANTPQPAVVQAVGGVAALAAQFAEAKSAKDVSGVLQAAAAPISTYETKYRKPVVALNALVGVSAGGEVVSTSGSAPSAVIGAFAPVGLHATAPFGDGNWHVGAMLSVINLGALVSARFSSDTSAASNGNTTSVGTTANIDFLNILSPGVFVTLGVARSPFIVGAGAQVLPRGREVDTTSMTTGATSTQNTASAQFLGFVSADVPLFPF